MQDFHAFNPNNVKRQNLDISSYKQKENPQFEHPWKIPNLLPDNLIQDRMPVANKSVLQGLFFLHLISYFNTWKVMIKVFRAWIIHMSSLGGSQRIVKCPSLMASSFWKGTSNQSY